MLVPRTEIAVSLLTILYSILRWQSNVDIEEARVRLALRQLSLRLTCDRIMASFRFPDYEFSDICLMEVIV